MCYCNPNIRTPQCRKPGCLPPDAPKLPPKGGPGTEEQMRAAVQAAVQTSGLRKLAASWGVSPSYLSDVCNGRRAPSDRIVQHLGFRRVVTVTYEPDPAAADWPAVAS